jgi:hypothetical protein
MIEMAPPPEDVRENIAPLTTWIKNPWRDREHCVEKEIGLPDPGEEHLIAKFY